MFVQWIKKFPAVIKPYILLACLQKTFCKTLSYAISLQFIAP